MIYAYLFAVYKTVKHPRKAHDILRSLCLRSIIYRSGAGISPNKIELFAVRKYIGWRRN